MVGDVAVLLACMSIETVQNKEERDVLYLKLRDLCGKRERAVFAVALLPTEQLHVA